MKFAPPLNVKASGRVDGRISVVSQDGKIAASGVVSMPRANIMDIPLNFRLPFRWNGNNFIALDDASLNTSAASLKLNAEADISSMAVKAQGEAQNISLSEIGRMFAPKAGLKGEGGYLKFDVDTVLKGDILSSTQADINAKMPSVTAAGLNIVRDLIAHVKLTRMGVPKISLGGVQYHLSTQAASLMATVDNDNDSIPYVSPSNKNLQCDSSVLADGTEQNLSLTQANYLNSQGIVTALNFSQGWVLWGNACSRFPSSSDPVERFISIRRMMNWIANSLVTTYFSQVDAPINRRLIETIMDSVAIWFNGLAAKGCILGGRIVFDSDDNPTTKLISGIVKFKVYVTPPPPAEQIIFELEFDPDYFATLFS